MAGVRDHATGHVRAAPVPDTTTATLQGFMLDSVQHDATVYTDEAATYAVIPLVHEAIDHSAGEYVRGQAHRPQSAACRACSG